MNIQCVIAIHLMRWLTNFYDFRFKWTATTAIGIHPYCIAMNTIHRHKHLKTYSTQEGRAKTLLLEKYTSHFIWKGSKGLINFYCVRGELETEQNCNILTPILMAITAFLSRSFGLLNRGLGGPTSLGHRHHSSIFYRQLIWTSRRQGYIIIWPPLFFLRASQFRIQITPSTVKVTPDLPISSTGCACYLHRCISHLTARPGQRSICNRRRQRSTEKQYGCNRKAQLASLLVSAFHQTGLDTRSMTRRSIIVGI